MWFIKTNQLILRPYNWDDFEDYYAYIMDRELQAMLGLEGVEDRDCALVNFQWLLDNRVFLALERRDSGRVVGHICIHPPQETLAGDPAFYGKKGASLSFAIAKWEQRKGLMTEALEALISKLFQSGEADYLDCEYASVNAGSAALQKKLGFRYWGTQRLDGKDLLINVIERDSK